MIKKLIGLALAAAVAAGLSLGSADAQAAPITYNLTLTAAGSGPSGTGSFVIDGDDFTGSGHEFFTPGDPAKTLLSLVINIDGRQFDISDAFQPVQIFFQLGNFAGITYMGTDTGGVVIAGALSYNYSGPGGASQGTVSAVRSTTPPTSVPQPATLLLLSAGVLALGLAMQRRRIVP